MITREYWQQRPSGELWADIDISGLVLKICVRPDNVTDTVPEQPAEDARWRYDAVLFNKENRIGIFNGEKTYDTADEAVDKVADWLRFMQSDIGSYIDDEREPAFSTLPAGTEARFQMTSEAGLAFIEKYKDSGNIRGNEPVRRCFFRHKKGYLVADISGGELETYEFPTSRDAMEWLTEGWLVSAIKTVWERAVKNGASVPVRGTPYELASGAYLLNIVRNERNDHRFDSGWEDPFRYWDLNLGKRTVYLIEDEYTPPLEMFTSEEEVVQYMLGREEC